MAQLTPTEMSSLLLRELEDGSNTPKAATILNQVFWGKVVQGQILSLLLQAHEDYVTS